jgi:Ca-activated chloride channel homolog
MALDWQSPWILLLALPALALLYWWDTKSLHPMQGWRRKALLAVRATTVLLLLLALAGPAKQVASTQQAVVMLLDHSHSLGETGLKQVLAQAEALQAQQPADTVCTYVAFGDEPALLPNKNSLQNTEQRLLWQREHGARSDYAKALDFARALFPVGMSRQMVLIGDGEQTSGDLLHAAQLAAQDGVTVHCLPVAGQRKPDVRITALRPSRTRLHEGATVDLSVDIESSLAGTGQLRLYENGLEVAQQTVEATVGQSQQLHFQRSPSGRDLYKYRAVLEGFPEDTLAANNEALTVVEVRGNLRLLLCEGSAGTAVPLQQAMQKENITLDLRAAGSLPQTVTELAGYDGVILNDIGARQLGETFMRNLHEYVDQLGGGLIMIGGPNSFALGGYHESPIEELLPVHLRATDEEEKQSSALAVVLDRSGSMVGEKLEIAKSAAVAAAEVLTRNDFIGVYAFDSEAQVVLPMTRVTSMAAISASISALASGGGTFLEPALLEARKALQRVKAKIKHIIVLTDGQTTGAGYEILASQCRAEGMTLSTVAIGEGSHVGLLQAMASSGGGQAYSTRDLAAITRIFTQDTLKHTGQLLHEVPFYPSVHAAHPLIAGMEPWQSPSLAGYVKTTPRRAAQLILKAENGDPLLVHWRYGLGKVSAFTSDVQSRWAGLWIETWPNFAQFWSQVLRETARPPQGHRMDLQLRGSGNAVQLTVDLLADEVTRKNGAKLKAEWSYLPSQALTSSMQKLKEMDLPQQGPGLYGAEFTPAEPGFYFVRVRSAEETASAVWVHQLQTEASVGRLNTALLKQVADSSGGQLLGQPAQLPSVQKQSMQLTEIWPWLVSMALGLFMIDIFLRRLEAWIFFWESLKNRDSAP